MAEQLNIAREVAALKRMTVRELRARYVEVFGEQTRSGNKDFLWKRIAWRMQASAEGDLSERARRRAEELANDADLRIRRPPEMPAPSPASNTVTRTIDFAHRAGLPMPGTMLTRAYKGRTITVTVLERGFEHDGTIYRSLSAIAKAVTGAHWNGNHFFRIPSRQRAQTEDAA
jgi:hypothetical protein